MKICLVNTPAFWELIGNDPVIIKDQQGIYPPLGLLSIAAVLLQNGHEVKVIDAQVDELNFTQVAEEVTKFKPDVVGLTVMTFTLIDCLKTIQEIRKHVSTIIVVGGPHPSIYPEESRHALGCDYVIVGEGEYTLLKLLRDIREGKATQTIYKQERFIEDLDVLPFPARELTPISKYYSVLAERSPTTTAFTSRGCPFKCSYCDRPALGKNFRSQSAKRVVDEMEWCQKHGIYEIFFYDDTFTVSKKRVLEICKEYHNRKLTIKWDIRSRVNTVDDEVIEAVSQSGCTRIHFGVESAVPRILREINKGISPEQVYKAFSLCKKYKVKTLAYFMMGCPTETFSDIKESLKMAKRLNADFMQMTILTPFPATEMYTRAINKGLIKGDPWRDYSLNPTLDFRPPVWDEVYSKEELEKYLRWFYKRFYLRPKFILDRILELRSFEQFGRYFKGGISLIRMSLVKESKLNAANSIHKLSKKTTATSLQVPSEKVGGL